MKNPLGDARHQLMPLVLLVAGILGFLVVRAAVVPKGFGQYGHFRPGALDDVRNLPLSFAGQGTCLDCHSDIGETRKTGKHAGVACEACHGPQGAHANSDDPAAHKPVLPDTAKLCVQCHEANSAKPAWFPQVVPAEHSGGAACGSCHHPHHPEMK